MEDYDGSDTTEFSLMQIMHDPATLASPDLLSEVSDMKQDLIKVSVLLTSENSEISCSSDARERSDKAREEEVDEPFEIVEKVKEDLEKVEEILREGTMDDTKRESAIGISVTIDGDEWVLLGETDVEESKSKNITEDQETLIQEVRITRDTISSSFPKRDMSGMVSYLSGDLEQCLQEPVPFSHSQDVDIVQESFKEVFVARAKHRPAEIKKPVRKKRKEREFASGSSEDDLERMSRSQSEESLDEDAVIGGSGPVFLSGPVSPRVVETPIGSIKDRVKALQMKVEEEKEVDNQNWKVNTSHVKEAEKSTKLPPKSPRSPKSQTERLEETMSVRELMKAFQTGQDPSKSKSGLFEHKAITAVTSEMATSDETQVPPTYDYQMTVTTQHLQEEAITTETSEKASPNVTQITTVVTSEASSSDMMQVPPTYDKQMTVSTQHLQEKNVVENKIIQESYFDPNTIQYKPMVDDGETVNSTFLNSTLSIQNTEGDPAITSNIIFNFKEETSREDLLSELTSMDQNGKPSQEQGRFETEEQQITSELLENEDPGLIPERMYYEDNIYQNRRLSVEPQISPDRKPSEDFSADIKAELEDSPGYLLFRRTSGEASKRYLMCRDGPSLDDEEQIHQVAVDQSKSNIITAFATAMVQGEPLLKSEIHEDSEESPDSVKHEALVDSPGKSTGTRTPYTSTCDNDTYDGLAETPQNSPEILVTPTEKTEVRHQEATETTYQSILVTSHERAESDKSVQLCSVTATKSKTSPYDSKIESPSLLTRTDSPSSDDSKMYSLSPSSKTESPSSTNSKTIVQETIEVMKWDSETSAHDMRSDSSNRYDMKPTEFSVINESEKILQHCHHSPDALDRPSTLDSLQPESISDSKTLWRTDSLETTLIREDGPSPKTPDSIEPSPNKESPWLDSLEGSPSGEENGQLSYIERVFSTSQSFASDSRKKLDTENNSEQDIYLESESSQGSHETPEMQCLSMTLEQKEEVLDSEDLHDFDALQRQFTPEEEMFKMAAKIKTFDEMEKDARVKKVKFNFDCDFKQLKEENLSPHESPLDFDSMLTKDSEEQCLENLTESGLQPSLSDEDYENPELEESSNKVSYVTSEILKTMDKGEQDHTHLKTVDLQTCTNIPSLATHVNKEKDYEQFSTEYHTTVTSGTTPEEDLVITSAESKTDIEVDADVDSNSPGERPTSEKALELVFPNEIIGTITAAKEVQNESPTDFCIYEEDNEGKPDKIPSSTPRDLVPWSAEVEDDEAFDAQIEAEEQKILALCTDRQSHGTTPDTPGRTPTEEGTPNPFLFQEGKLFEMTRGGAIDMTKRTMEEEEERLAFFPINEDPSEDFEQVNSNTSESVAGASFELTADGLVHKDRFTEEPDAKSDGFSQTGAKIKPEHSEPIKFPLQSELKSPTEDNGIHEDALIPNVDTATYTVTRTVYSEQESSDSSVDDEQHSVVEMPISNQVSMISSSASAHTVSQQQFQTSHSMSTPFKDIAAEIEDTTSKPKTAVKSASFDQILGPGDSIEQNQRPKSEADIGISEWSMSVVDDHTNIESNYTKPKISSSQMAPQYSASSQPELPAKVFQELDPSRNTECDETKGDRASVELGIESLKAIRPPSVGDDVFESRAYWEDCVETQMQRISDSTTPDQSKGTSTWHLPPVLLSPKFTLTP